jgi:hypothetical protein
MDNIIDEILDIFTSHRDLLVNVTGGASPGKVKALENRQTAAIIHLETIFKEGMETEDGK